jgi:hypothetical protein
LKNRDALIADLNCARISSERSRELVADLDGKGTASLEINLNEAQRLSVIQTDTTE